MDDQEESSGRQMRHAFLFLLFPDRFDPIVSGEHKRAIVNRWYAEAAGSPEELDFSNRLVIDRAVDEVRQYLQAKDPEFDFYIDPWISEWHPARAKPKPKDDLVDQERADAWAKERFGTSRVWAMGAGEGARLWPEFERDGIIAMGLEEVGDLSEYKSRGALNRDIAEARGVNNPFNDSLAGWQFAHEMKVGDFVIAKAGRSKLLGWGVVKSGYRHDPSRAEYANVRDVEWRKTGRWTIPEGRHITTKTLTEFTSYTEWLHMAFHPGSCDCRVM
jgi:5-methylcytosine-specific restriction enzyme B